MVDIYTDGSGKTGRYAYVVEQTGRVKILQEKGITNNEAEYKAIIAALNENRDKDVSIHSDSQLIVNQLNKDYAIKEDRLRDLAQEVWKLCEGRNVTFDWLPREKNKAGKVLG
ncbi:MAG: ribonuclease HI family protein [Candidatus Aenigmarchaeota archaeon]|nr:ribonuclease HI family protein [Candidatus Aenigmarchaeota archaeon]